MVRFSVLASGSKGNSTLISGGKTKILLDCGLSCRETFRRLRAIGEEPESLNAILITHDHVDHVNGISVTARKLGIPVYFTQATHQAWQRWIAPRRQMSYTEWMEQKRREKADREAAGETLEASGESESESHPLSEGMADAAAETLAEEAELAAAEANPQKREATWLPAVEYFEPGNAFSIGDIEVSPFTVPHDAADPCGFVLRAEGVRIGYATDLGYMPPNVKMQLKGLDLLYLEANHDLEMLRDGPYPWAVKQRVLSRVGHLSNDATAEFLRTDYDGQARHIVLAHLSESNNLPELARVAVEQALNEHGRLLGNQLLIAEQHQPLESIYF